MADLSVKVCGVEFNNPLIAASGTFGFGMEYSELYPLEKLGGISCKGITLTPVSYTHLTLPTTLPKIIVQWLKNSAKPMLI